MKYIYLYHIKFFIILLAKKRTPTIQSPFFCLLKPCSPAEASAQYWLQSKKMSVEGSGFLYKREVALSSPSGETPAQSSSSSQAI